MTISGIVLHSEGRVPEEEEGILRGGTCQFSSLNWRWKKFFVLLSCEGSDYVPWCIFETGEDLTFYSIILITGYRFYNEEL